MNFKKADTRTVLIGMLTNGSVNVSFRIFEVRKSAIVDIPAIDATVNKNASITGF